MNSKYVDLHVDKKTVGIIMAIICLLLCILDAVMIVSTRDQTIQLTSLFHSDYLFSATVRGTRANDSFLVFNAEIGFSKTINASTGINANVLMQSDTVQYSNMVYWNTQILPAETVAISRNTANAYDLREGDKVYSKSIVDGITREYTIAQIVPEVSEIRANKRHGIRRGIIIMGYDKQYAENISNESIVFADTTIENLAKISNGMPQNILYRSDEIANVVTRLLPFVAVFCGLSLLVIGIGMVLLTKHILANFQRLITIGFDNKKLNLSYCRFIEGLGTLGISAVFIFEIIFAFALKINQVGIILMFALLLVRLLFLICTTPFLKSRIWRS